VQRATRVYAPFTAAALFAMCGSPGQTGALLACHQ